MSNAIFPVLPGLAWNSGKTPMWSTRVQKTTSGRELRASLFSYPLWQFKLSFDVLRADSTLLEMQTLAGFFNARQGSYDSFLYIDPTDKTVTAQVIGTGDGTTTTFTCVRSLGGYSEPIMIFQSISVFVNGVLQTEGPSMSFLADPARVVFATPPSSGAIITITGIFYYRCRFLHDSTEFDNFMKDLWNLKKIEFITVKP